MCLENLHLLVVEAEPEAQTAIVTALESCGAKVVAVDSVQRGLVAVNQQRPDVVISDLHLPDGDGCSLMQTVKERTSLNRGTSVPAIAVSACARTVNLDQVAAAGFKRYIAKPICAERLVGLVARLTDRT